MAIRTAQTRAYLQGEATKRDEWGINTVIVNKRGVACPLCLKYVGQVFYDDVWGSAPVPSPEKYPRLSTAIDGGLYHPNCKDIHTTYFEGISTPPEPMTEEEKKEASRVYNLEQQQRYNERQIRKYKRLSDGSVDPENRGRYYKKLSAWQEKQHEFVKANGDVLKRRLDNEAIRGIGPIDNADYRKTVERMRREVALEKQKLTKNSEKVLTNSSKRVNIGLQFFAEKDIKKQESGSLRRAIRKFERNIELHRQKISDPKKYAKDWDTLDVREQNGMKKHWQKEIDTFQTNIDNRIAELKERGEYDE
jgi:hypothetical protein